MNDDDDSPKPKEALANASVAKLRKLAEKNPDDSLLNDVARNVEESVRAIDSAEVAVAQVRQELKRRAEVMEGLKEEEKKLAATMNQKLPIEDNFVDHRTQSHQFSPTDTADDMEEHIRQQIEHLRTTKAATDEERKKLQAIIDDLIATENAMKDNREVRGSTLRTRSVLSMKQSDHCKEIV